MKMDKVHAKNNMENLIYLSNWTETPQRRGDEQFEFIANIF